jgi:hypothetical protein
MPAVAALFVLGLIVAYAVIAFWKPVLIFLGACCFALMFAGVFSLLSTLSHLRHGE